jgi:hypothetical protein
MDAQLGNALANRLRVAGQAFGQARDSGGNDDSRAPVFQVLSQRRKVSD